MNAIISDATSLIILGKLGRVDLLHVFFDRVVIPSLVMKEVLTKPDHDPLVWNQTWLEPVDGTGLALFREFSLVVDSGESEALALADHEGLPLLIDEKKGRSIATRRGIPVIGLVGLLVRGVQRDLLEAQEAARLLAEARTLGFRISESLAREFHTAILRHSSGVASNGSH